MWYFTSEFANKLNILTSSDTDDNDTLSFDSKSKTDQAYERLSPLLMHSGADAVANNLSSEDCVIKTEDCDNRTFGIASSVTETRTNADDDSPNAFSTVIVMLYNPAILAIGNKQGEKITPLL
jgi:hypothetical protein